MLTASDSEKCASCGRGYRIIYRVPDDIWARIAPDKDSLGDHPEHQGGGLLCPLCADERARELGIRLVFDADVDWRSDVVVVPDREDKPTIPAGMVVWHGGPKPADWSGEAVQFRSGKVMQAPVGAVWKLGWDHSYGDGDIIAYTPKPTPADSRSRRLPQCGGWRMNRTDEQLLSDAVRCARPHGDAWRPRWVAVMDTFAIGSTYARELCARFGFNPDENVKHR